MMMVSITDVCSSSAFHRNKPFYGATQMQNRCVDKIEKPFVVFSIDRIYPRLNLPAIRIMSTPFDVNTNVNTCYPPPPPHMLIPDKQFWRSLSFCLRVLCAVSNRRSLSRLLLLVHLCSVRVQSLSSIAGGFPIFQCASFPRDPPLPPIRTKLLIQVNHKTPALLI